MSISRRDALTGTTAAVAVAALPITVTAQANDAPLEALYAEWRTAESTWLKATAVADNARLDALRACGEYPVEGNYSSDAQFEAAWDSRRAASRAAHARYDVVELKRKADAAHSAEQTALYRLIEAPAEGPRGVQIKITAFIEEIEVVGMDNRMLVTIRNDLERLAKTA